MAQNCLLTFPFVSANCIRFNGYNLSPFSDTPKVAPNVSKKHNPAYFISGNFGDACLAWLLGDISDEGETGLQGIEN